MHKNTKKILFLSLITLTLLNTSSSFAAQPPAPVETPQEKELKEKLEQREKDNQVLQ